jgi:hypothetical protein
MACHEDASSNCAVQYWCVCQWAFSPYIQNAGGRDQIQDVVSEATYSLSESIVEVHCLPERTGLHY